MRSPFILLLIVAGLAVSSCNRDTVQLDFTNAKGEVPNLLNFTFRFNKSLVKDSMLNIWDSTEYVSFEPKIPGRFRWESPDQLVFSPAAPLSPATTYKVKISSEVLRYSRYGRVEKADDLSFHTADLSLDNMQVVWALQDENSRSAIPQVDLYFNYPVQPDDLKDKLSVSIEGEKKEFSCITQSAAEKLSIRIPGLQLEDKSYETVAVIEKGLKPVGGNNPTREKMELHMSVPSPYILVIQNVESQHDGTEGTVRISTSQQLVSDDIKRFIRISPEIKFNVETTETGMVIRSEDFNMEKSYNLDFLKGLRGKLGGSLKEDISQQVAFGELDPDITFTNNKAVYLSGQGARNIEVRITNVPTVKLIISKVYENNLLMADRYGYSPRTSGNRNSDGDYYDYEYSSYNDAQLGDVIYEKEIDTRLLPKSNNSGGRLLNLSQFEDRLPDFNGVYHIMIRSTTEYWVRDSRFVSMSDIGLIAKEGIDKIYVFANSIKTANPLSGINILVYGNNNQLLGTAATNNEGVAEIVYVKKDFNGFRPALIIAKSSDDFNYLPFNATGVNTSRFDVGGKRNNPTGLDAFIYAERDIYRPGEKINFSVIVRDQHWKNPGEIPLLLKMLMPNGKELKSFRKSLNEQGSAEGSLEFSVSALTGTYNLEVYTSNEILLATETFNVEEFVPDRIKVNAKLDKESLKIGETAQLSVTATNFFGPPSANRNYEMEIQVRRKYFSPDKFNAYDFSLSNLTSVFDKTVKEGKTDDKGNATQAYTLPATLQNMGVLEASFYTTVFDETGRPVSRNISLDLYTQDVFFGIRGQGYYYQPLNQPAKFLLAAVDKSGNGVVAKAKVQVIKHEYHTNLVKSGNYFRYESVKEDKLMVENLVNVNSSASYTYIPRTPGDYEVRVFVPGANTYVSESFYSYGNWGWGSDNSSFEVNNEGNIDIETDKNSFYSGETAKVLFKAPFDGRLLVTVESDKLITYQYVDVEKRTASIDLKLTEDYLPNVYITATLIKPHEVSDMPLTVAHGFQNIKVEEKSRKIPVEIISAKTVRSRTSQQVKVKAEPGSYITLAAVDNGVLQVSNFKTPNPYEHFYSKKALQVAAYDLYPLLFPEIRGKLSSTGGDGDLEMDKRVNPMPAKRIKIVSFWSGIAKADGNGEAAFKVDIPQFSGEIRLMAVAYNSQRFGSSENTITVADPIVISTALPRFLSPGDTVSVPITLSNTTNRAANLSADLKLEGPLKIVGRNSQSVSVEGKSESIALFKLVADPAIAVGRVKVVVNGLGEKFYDETEISVRPASTLQKVTGSGSVAGGADEKITIGLSDFIPSSIDYKLVISRSPALALGKQLSYLVQYPYGCTEQTVSAAFPQLYFGDLADLMGAKDAGKQNANQNILEAIRKIKMRQLYNGAVTLWDGGGQEHWWATVYAAHFLLEARKAGFIIDNSLLETMLGYLSSKLKNRETISYYYNRDQNKRIAPKEVPYSLYVLSLAGRSNIPSMNYYKSNPQLLALDGKYLLSAAYAIAGDKKSFNSLLPAAFTGEESLPQTGGSFYSDIRDEAIALNALLEVDPGNKQIPLMAKHVSDKLNSRQWLSTQERAFAFLALGKIARTAKNTDITAEIRTGGKTIARLNGGQWKGDLKSLKGNNIEVVAKGSGRLYYFWEAEGISSSGSYKEEDNYLKVRKKFYDRYGKEIFGNTFKQNDLVVIGISLEKSYSGRIDNVVITDLLPAGFEIENPRTKEVPGMEWIKDGYSPTSLDVRDDRIHFFVDLYNNRQTYYYAVRAVSPGSYKMGPVSADAMYNGEYHSYNGAGLIKVVN
ncbi:MAG: alpha-2-macroglobulin family protein [Terrimonas sp.]|nr:alpha-2-macroglobulin family protein [Terrimonas sp.]